LSFIDPREGNRLAMGKKVVMRESKGAEWELFDLSRFNVVTDMVL
jgi:hypothetical protein